MSRMNNVRYFMLACYLTRLLHRKRILISSLGSFYAHFTAIKAVRFKFFVLKDYSSSIMSFPQKIGCCCDWLLMLLSYWLVVARIPVSKSSVAYCLVLYSICLLWRNDVKTKCVYSVLCDVLLVEL